MQIKEADIDFWGTQFETLKYRYNARIYPPRVKVTVDVPHELHRIKLPVQFEGCSGDSQLDMEILFPLSTNKRQLHHLILCTQ